MIREVWQAVFGEDITARKASGRNQFRVVCPFHDDHSPSCDVSTAKDAFVCRSCGAAGGYLDVVVRAGFADSRRSAVEWLQRRGLRVA